MEEIRNPGQELPEAEAAQTAKVEAVLPAEETAEASAQAEAAAEAETVQIPEPLEKPEQPKVSCGRSGGTWELATRYVQTQNTPASFNTR